MSNRYYGVDLGGDMPTDVTEAGSSTAKALEFVVTYDATGMNRTKVLLALGAIYNYIAQDTWPTV